jgi:hypothetical protein
MTRRGLAALAAAATGLGRPAAAAQAQAAPERAAGMRARLEQAAEAVERCKLQRNTQPAVQFIP